MTKPKGKTKTSKVLYVRRGYSDYAVYTRKPKWVKEAPCDCGYPDCMEVTGGEYEFSRGSVTTLCETDFESSTGIKLTEGQVGKLVLTITTIPPRAK